jgi:hypothetical protein
MRTRFLGVLTLTSLLATGAAFAADSAAPAASTPATTMEKSDATAMSHSGVVKSFDAKTHKLTLKDGSSFVLDESLKGNDLKANEKVSFNYTTDGQTKTVTGYKIMPKS